MVDNRVLDVKIEDLPDSVENHRGHESLDEGEREALRGDAARDDVPPLEIASQGLKFKRQSESLAAGDFNLIISFQRKIKGDQR